MKKIFWLAGDKSGDIHSSWVIKKLPDFEHVGIGGMHMQQQGLRPLFPFDRFCVMGFAEILAHLPFFIKVEHTIKKYLMESKPDLIILIDYPGLNLRIAKIAHELKIKVLYYICPQFWAWKYHRVNQLKKYCEFVTCIFPFEKEILEKHGIPCDYVGHPVIEEISYEYTKEDFARKNGLDPEKKWISFFPGSRITEVSKLLPIFMKTINLLKQVKPEYEILISKSNTISDKKFMNLLKGVKDYHLISGNTYEMMKYSHFSIVKSGTSTFEAASIGNPFAIVYITNHISYNLAKKMVKVKYIGMPNLIFNKPVIKELIQHDVNPNKVMETILSYTENPAEHDSMVEALKGFQKLMGEKSASDEVAKRVRLLS